MVDMTDDWMNPSSSGVTIGWKGEPAENKDEFIIERARRLICFGNPGSIVTWEQWSFSYDTAAERDAALEKLSAEHPMWSLRARTRNRWKERHGIFDDPHPGINE